MSDIMAFLADPAERRKLLASTLDVLNRGAVAGTLGAPVDLINLGINAAKAGYGYAGHKMGLLSASDMPQIDEKPVGGSEWIAEQMQKRGLLGNYRSPVAETIAGGLLAPLAGAAVQARAPQIAAGLLKMQENAARPSDMRMQGQRGAIVYHGSPHKFDKFDASKIGTGEGAQAYGHGLYFAESPDVAQSYAQSVKANRSKPGQVYKVDLPDDAIAKMLDWDKPLSQQPELRKILKSASANVPDMFEKRLLEKAAGDKADNFWGSGAEFYRSLMAAKAQNAPAHIPLDKAEDLIGQRGASMQLNQIGIPGIRYLDGGSRGAGSGTSNFVVFPGEESLLRILERNGQVVP